MKSTIYLSGKFKIGINSTVKVGLDLRALGIQNSTITGIFGDYVSSIKQESSNNNVQFPIKLGNSNVDEKIDIILKESLSSKWTLKSFPLYIYISTKEHGKYSHLVQIELGVEPEIVLLSGKIDPPNTVSLGNLTLESANAIQSSHKYFNIKNTGELPLDINKISFLEYDGENVDYVSFLDYSGNALSYPFSIAEGQTKTISVAFNTQSSHTDDNYLSLLPLPFNSRKLKTNLEALNLEREVDESLNNTASLHPDHCKIEIRSNDRNNPISIIPIVQTKFVAPIIVVDEEDTIDITNVVEGSDNYREIAILNPSPTEDLIVSEISTDYYVTTNNGQSSGTPIDYMSINHEGSLVDWSTTNITIKPRQKTIFTLNFLDAKFPKEEITGVSEFPYYQNFNKTITIKSNAINTTFSGNDTYANVKSNNSGQTKINFEVSIVKKGVDASPTAFINPDFDIVLGGANNPNEPVNPDTGSSNVTYHNIAEAIGRKSTNSDWSSYSHLNIDNTGTSENEIDIFDLIKFTQNMSSYEVDSSNLNSYNAEAILLQNPLGGLEGSIAGKDLPFSILNKTTSNFTSTPLGTSSDNSIVEKGDSIEYKVTISTNNFSLHNKFHREVPNNIAGSSNGNNFSSVKKIDAVIKSLGKKSSDSDWESHKKYNFVGTALTTDTEEIDIEDLESFRSAIQTADDAITPTKEKITSHFGRKKGDTPDSGQPIWSLIKYLDLNDDDLIDIQDLVIVINNYDTSTLFPNNWTIDSGVHTYDATNKIQIIKDWDDNNEFVYRSMWNPNLPLSNFIETAPGIHFSSISFSKTKESDTYFDLTVTLHARRKSDPSKKEYSKSKTIRMFSGHTNIPQPEVNYKLISRRDAKFEDQGISHHKNLEDSNSLTDPKWDVFDVINHSNYAKNSGISEGMKGLWIENNSSGTTAWGTYNYDWKFSSNSNGVDDPNDYGFVRSSDNKIVWKTAIPSGSSSSYNVVDSSAFETQRTSWNPQGLVYKTNGKKEIRFSATLLNNSDNISGFSTTNPINKKYVQIYNQYNEKLEITPIEAQLNPNTLIKNRDSVAHVVIKNTSTQKRKITIQKLREFPNKIILADDKGQDSISFDLDPNTSKTQTISVIPSAQPQYQKGYSEGQLKIYSDYSSEYLVLDLYGDSIGYDWNLGTLDVEMPISDNYRMNQINKTNYLFGFNQNYSADSPHSLLIDFSISDSASKGTPYDGYDLGNLNVDLSLSDQKSYFSTRTHNILENKSLLDFSLQDSKTNVITENSFKAIKTNNLDPEVNFSISDSKSYLFPLSHTFTSDIIVEVSDSYLTRQLNKEVKVSSSDPVVELKLEDSRTKTTSRSHSLNDTNRIIDLSLSDDKLSLISIDNFQVITVNGVSPEIPFIVEDSKVDRKKITHTVSKGSSTTIEVKFEMKDERISTISQNSYKAITVNNSNPEIVLYWRDGKTSTI